jgi:type I site-specific restriction endonuclease
VQDRKTFDFVNHQRLALREAVMKPGHGRADYLLYVDQRVVGVIEAKPEGNNKHFTLKQNPLRRPASTTSSRHARPPRRAPNGRKANAGSRSRTTRSSRARRRTSTSRG